MHKLKKLSIYITLISLATLMLGSVSFPYKIQDLVTLSVDLSALGESGIDPSDFLRLMDLEAIDIDGNEVAMGENQLRRQLSATLYQQLLNPEMDEYGWASKKGKPRIGYYYYVREEVPKELEPANYRSYSSDSRSATTQLRSYLLTKMVRSPEQIRSLHNQYSRILYTIVPSGLYHGSSLSLFTKGLIQSYEDLQSLPDKEQKLSSWYEQFAEHSGGFCTVAEYQHGILKDYLSDDIKEMFDETYDLCSAEPILNDAIWMYSFWVRRFHEGNAEAVYEVLTKIREHYDETSNKLVVKRATVDKDVLDFSGEAKMLFDEGEKYAKKLEDKALTWEDLTVPQAKLVAAYENKMASSGGFYMLSPFYLSGCAYAPDEPEASSQLDDYKGISYGPKNLVDRDLSTAWVEGTPGMGIGTTLTYKFSMEGEESDNLYMLGLYNGYAKSIKAWKANGRVKTLKMSWNGNPIAKLELADSRQLQTVDLHEFRYLWGKDPSFTFEILEVYKGDKYNDIALSQLAFGYLGCQCFPAGTMISMADGSQKAIESLEMNDSILSYDFEEGQIVSASVLGLSSFIHEDLQTIHFVDGNTLSLTQDHPVWTQKGWASFKPGISQHYAHLDGKASALREGSTCFKRQFGELKPLQIHRISHSPYAVPTYTINRLSRHHSFFANGMLVGIED